jgi:hypothetical protein
VRCSRVGIHEDKEDIDHRAALRHDSPKHVFATVTPLYHHFPLLFWFNMTVAAVFLASVFLLSTLAEAKPFSRPWAPSFNWGKYAPPAHQPANYFPPNPTPAPYVSGPKLTTNFPDPCIINVNGEASSTSIIHRVLHPSRHLVLFRHWKRHHQYPHSHVNRFHQLATRAQRRRH